MKTPPKKYEIDTLEKLINCASTKNFDRLSPDFLIWLYYTVSVIEHHRKKHPEETKGKSNTEVMKSTFIWVDDGEHKLKHFTIKDPSTGEVHEIPFDKMPGIKITKKRKSKP